jgi:hypothetical protein
MIILRQKSIKGFWVEPSRAYGLRRGVLHNHMGPHRASDFCGRRGRSMALRGGCRSGQYPRRRRCGRSRHACRWPPDSGAQPSAVSSRCVINRPSGLHVFTDLTIASLHVFTDLKKYSLHQLSVSYTSIIAYFMFEVEMMEEVGWGGGEECTYGGGHESI